MLIRSGIVLFVVVVLAAACEKPPVPEITIWHGQKQQVGQGGLAQDDFNLMGEVSNVESVVSLGYRLNNRRLEALTFGEDGFEGRRLAAVNHFNADIPIEELETGKNTISVQLVDEYGRAVAESVTVEKVEGDSRLPVYIRWKDVADPQSVVQLVDGEWVRTDKGLRTGHTGYDRLFVVGAKNWQDYEVTVPITINGVTAETGRLSGGNGIGVVLRFVGHVNGGHRRFPTAQPKWGYQPFGAIGWLRWQKGRPEVSPQRQFFAGFSDERLDLGLYPVRIGGTYFVKARCETLSEMPVAESLGGNRILIEENEYIVWKDGRREKQKLVDAGPKGISRYSFKIWQAGEPEPAVWDWQVTQVSVHALRKGGVAFLAHHVDGTFGDITVVPLEKASIPGQDVEAGSLELAGSAR